MTPHDIVSPTLGRSFPGWIFTAEVMIIFYAVWMGIDADLNTELLITDAQAMGDGLPWAVLGEV